LPPVDIDDKAKYGTDENIPVRESSAVYPAKAR
jgi:hypothetical protein